KMAHAHGPMRRHWSASLKKRPFRVGLGGLGRFGEFGRRVPKSGRRRNSLPGREAHSSRSVLALPAIFTWPGMAIFENFHRRGIANRPQGVADAALASA